MEAVQSHCVLTDCIYSHDLEFQELKVTQKGAMDPWIGRMTKKHLPISIHSACLIQNIHNVTQHQKYTL